MRRSRKDEGSLDLLLDTVCNMFGGIVLIAILLALLSQFSGQESSASVDEQETTSKVVDVQAQKEELAALRELVERRKQQVKEPPNENDNATKESVKQLKQRDVVLKEEKEDLKDNIQKAMDEEKRLFTVVAKLDFDIEEAAEEAAKIREIIERRPLRMPRLHSSNKSPVFLAMQNGRLYAISEVDSSYSEGKKRTYDTKDVDVESEPGGLHLIEIVPHAGQAITAPLSSSGTVEKVLRNVDRRNEYLCFAVFPDSYAQFNILKRYFIEQQYEYNWEPMSHAQIIQIQPAESTFVQ